MSETWLLFEDASHDAVQCTLYPLPKDYPRPVDAYIVFEHSGDFTIAAQKAVHAVFDLARKRSIPVQPVNAGFDLSRKTGLDAGMAGQSGGLCFALAFAKKLLNLDLPDLAATGIISSDGRISPVNGIEAKLRTALTLLNGNDLIFFPEDNQSQIPDSLITQIKHKNIRLHPVTTLDQAMDILTGDVAVDPAQAPSGHRKTSAGPLLKPSPRNRLGIAVLVLMFTAACLYAGFQIWGKNPAPPTISESPAPLSHEITMPLEDTPLPAETAPPGAAQNNAQENLDATEPLNTAEITNNEDTPGSKTPVTENKGFD